MTRHEFREWAGANIVVLDGALGSELIKRGMPPGSCPELWALQNKETVFKIQNEYSRAGSDVIYTPTFGGNRMKLDEFGAGERVFEINFDLAKLSRKAAGKKLVFGDIAPTGRFVEPFGDLLFEDAVAVFSEQASALLSAGVDGFVIETMIDIQEARAALIAVRSLCNLPTMVSMTFDNKGWTLNGNDPVSCLVTLQSLGADAVGCNCSSDIASMREVIKQMKAYAALPLMAKPNAGLPRLQNGVSVFDMSPADFADDAGMLVEDGVNFLGGCCGTNAYHISVLKRAVKNRKAIPPVRSNLSAVSSARKTCFLGNENPLAVIGERINPTGKKICRMICAWVQ